jgi:uncharacterized protein involved in type VI secretion and phage assembly
MAKSPLLIELKVAPAPKLRFLSMSGAEELSRPFEYSVVGLAKPTEPVKFDDVLGMPIQVTAGVRQDNPRIYHGLITAVAFERTVGSYLGYKLTMRPWLWLLTRGAKARIFQQKSVPEIIWQPSSVNTAATFDDQTHRHLPPARVLRAVPRDRLRLRQPPDGRRRHLLLLQARSRQAHAGAG